MDQVVIFIYRARGNKRQIMEKGKRGGNKNQRSDSKQVRVAQNNNSGKEAKQNNK
jgi:hypothetical protein